MKNVNADDGGAAGNSMETSLPDHFLWERCKLEHSPEIWSSNTQANNQPFLPW